MYVAMEAGIGLGAFLSGAIYANNAAMLPYTFWIIALFPLLAFLYLQFGVKKKMAAVTG
jgi:predicted MFS family arabinose efflux permease